MTATDSSVTTPPAALLRAATERYGLDPISDVSRLDAGYPRSLESLG